MSNVRPRFKGVELKLNPLVQHFVTPLDKEINLKGILLWDAMVDAMVEEEVPGDYGMVMV